jgi:hypothetical protein
VTFFFGFSTGGFGGFFSIFFFSGEGFLTSGFFGWIFSGDFFTYFFFSTDGFFGFGKTFYAELDL